MALTSGSKKMESRLWVYPALFKKVLGAKIEHGKALPQFSAYLAAG
jgi:hypothetical protein